MTKTKIEDSHIKIEELEKISNEKNLLTVVQNLRELIVV